MAYFDPEDYIDEIDTSTLRKELKKREEAEAALIKHGAITASQLSNKLKEQEREAIDNLNEISDYLRKQGLIRWAVSLEDVRNDFIINKE